LPKVWPRSVVLDGTPFLRRTTYDDGAPRQGGPIGKVCVWSGSNWTVPKAGRDGSDSNYSGDVYPNTMISIDNSASSVANYYPAKDVTWHWEPSNKGFALCVDSGMGYASLPGWDNDMYSSHQVSLDDNAC
jgi:hypothetical protein